MTEALILTEVRPGEGERRTALITLNRPKQLNALNDALMDQLGAALLDFDRDPGIGCIVVTGSEKAFAAGADISAMARKTFMEAHHGEFITRNWETMRQVKKPVIAAVAGFALGGGCELAMMCDFIIAAETAKFGQPEIKIGIIPGAGGTQRLPRAVGKSKAMDMVLTARMMDAAEAERAGLVSRVVPADKLLDEALAAAREELAQHLHGVAIERVAAVVRPVQDAFGVAELGADARAGQRLDLGAQVLQQRFDLAPVDVGGNRVVEDFRQQLRVLLAHWKGRAGMESGPSIPPRAAMPAVAVR